MITREATVRGKWHEIERVIDAAIRLRDTRQFDAVFIHIDARNRVQLPRGCDAVSLYERWRALS